MVGLGEAPGDDSEQEAACCCHKSVPQFIRFRRDHASLKYLIAFLGLSYDVSVYPFIHYIQPLRKNA